MDQRPEQPPEGKLIADAAARMKLSIREAARRAGISYGRWRQVTQGYQNVSPGSYAPVRAPARTLARMAQVVGIPAEAMETSGQRPDVAEVMRETTRRETAPSRDLPPNFPGVTPAMAADSRPYTDAVRDLVQLARTHHPDGMLDGRRVFPLDRRGAFYWDASLALFPDSEEAVIQLTALALAHAAQRDAAGREGSSATGLIRARHGMAAMRA